MQSPGRQPVLVGRLIIARSGQRKRPTLVMRFWSPAEKGYRELDLPDHFRPEGLVEAQVPDPVAPHQVRSILVGADPDNCRQSAETIRYFLGRLSAWQSEQRAAGDLAERPRFAVPQQATTPSTWITPY